jgi:hypothetical protein
VPKQTNKNHYSPTLANKRWTNESSGWKFRRYYRCPHQNKVVEQKREVGLTGWGFEHNLYPQELEDQLDKSLENKAEILYEKLMNNEIFTADERMKWGQFIVTQAVRTPTFLRYRDFIERKTGGDFSYKRSIAGCPACHDNKYIACRNWIILEAHEDDFFVRTDNPVYMTGFLGVPTTSIYYPLSPKKCFVACSTPEYFLWLKEEQPPMPLQQTLKLEKGDAYLINFELIKSADKSIILAIKDNNNVINQLTLNTLGSYPQIPFCIFEAENEIESEQKLENLISIMRTVDGVEYPFKAYPFQTFYGPEFSMGVNLFSVFGLIQDK